MRVSIVIPTFNRGDKLAVTVQALLANDPTGLDEIEIIVVDDGSRMPAEKAIRLVCAKPPFTLRTIRQANAGPASARNTGFRETKGEIVIFVDDDMIAPKDLIRAHVAAHRRHPQSVICGRGPFIEPSPSTPLFRFINSLGFDPAGGSQAEFLSIPVVTSQQISVERAMFDREEAVYRDDLATPAAEEFELSLRLCNRGIAIWLASRIEAMHDHPVTLGFVCRQQYKHAVGCAEAAMKYPATRTIKDLDHIIKTNGDPVAVNSLPATFKRAIKRFLALKRARAVLLNTVRLLEQVAPSETLLAPIYRATIGAYFYAGVRDGLRRYSADCSAKGLGDGHSVVPVGGADLHPARVKTVAGIDESGLAEAQSPTRTQPGVRGHLDNAVH
jgi:glycosyltransferase involved in cell wall biosynthesis